MASSHYVDSIHLFLRAGNGGPGAIHFRRTRSQPKGGPDGGNGGRGAHILLEGNPHMNTLLHLRFRKHLIAPNGAPGGAKEADGAGAQDLIIQVPLGTIVKEAISNRILAEITEDKQRACIAKGGKGGLGNAHFKSPTRQAPQFAQSGQTGTHLEVIVELKLIADVGIVGMPNAGKSTLLSVVSAARPLVAHYPFTTLTPQLGVVQSDKLTPPFVMADIPGLIEGASRGKGLGLRFLRHIERTSVLLYTIPVDHQNIPATYTMLQQELMAHGIAIADKHHCLALTKADLINTHQTQALVAQLPETMKPLIVSSHTRLGLQNLKKHLSQLVKKSKQ